MLSCRAQLKEVRREVEALMERPHPNIVLLMGVCLKPPAIITELCETGSLDQVLARVSSSAEREGGRGCTGGMPSGTQVTAAMHYHTSYLQWLIKRPAVAECIQDTAAMPGDAGLVYRSFGHAASTRFGSPPGTPSW